MSEIKNGIEQLDSNIQKLRSKILSLSIPAIRNKLKEKPHSQRKCKASRKSRQNFE